MQPRADRRILRDEFKWNYLVAFAMIIAAVYFIFNKW